MMSQRISTTYAALLRKICAQGLTDRTEIERLERLIECGTPEAIGFAAHELLRHLIRTGRLQLRDGHVERHATKLRAADPRRGHLISLPNLVTPERPAVRLPQDATLGPPPAFSTEQITKLFQEQSHQSLLSVERSADVKGVVTGILKLARELLTVPATLCLTHALPAPNAIGVGLRCLFQDTDALGMEEAPRMPDAWKPWLEEAKENPGTILYLPDFTLMNASQRPLPQGSSLIVPLQESRSPWDALLVAVAREPFWFDRERLAKMRMFIPHFRRRLNYAVHLQTVISYDFLTSVYNRSFFEDQLARVIAGAARKKQSFALLILDIDNFKAFNSRYGYDAGDTVLQSVARILKRALRTTDVLARYGGEEFAIILTPPVTREESSLISKRLLAAVENLQVEIPTLEGMGARVGVTVSIGGTLFPENGSRRDELWSETNRMLLIAKDKGKNCVQFR